ncbi:GNAT family N-acetyltransferase [bacterium]|nr:GNAT family N-acetyltransferase [bacterium]MCI0603566.1 GNAT family N-acetyltransferase [bacterium]
MENALPLLIRTATPNDAGIIAQIDVDSMRPAYSGILPKSYLAKLSVREHKKNWKKRLKETETFVLVAENAEREVLGYAYAGRTRKQDPIYAGEIYRIYIHPSHQRRGVGRSLMRVAAERLAAEGIDSLLIWVLAANPARKFYEALGGKLVRSVMTEVAGLSLEGVAYGWTDTRILRL